MLTAITVVALLGLAAAGPPAGAQEGPSELTEAGTPLAVSDVVEGRSRPAARRPRPIPACSSSTRPPPSRSWSSSTTTRWPPTRATSRACPHQPVRDRRAPRPRLAGGPGLRHLRRGRRETFVAALDDEIPRRRGGRVDADRLRRRHRHRARRPDRHAGAAGRGRRPAQRPAPADHRLQPRVHRGPAGVHPARRHPRAGARAIVGVLDSGAWPEHPSYADPGNLPAPRPTLDGAPRACNFGDNPLTPAPDPFGATTS